MKIYKIIIFGLLIACFHADVGAQRWKLCQIAPNDFSQKAEAKRYLAEKNAAVANKNYVECYQRFGAPAYVSKCAQQENVYKNYIHQRDVINFCLSCYTSDCAARVK